ncbi:MAG: DUF3488 and transglutaminase-like domain-containing protein [Faecousia sp.]
MKRDRITQSLWAALIAFCMTFGSLGAMATGMDLLESKALLPLALWCAAWAAGLSALNLLKFAPWSALLIALGLAWGWFYGPLEASTERLIFELTTAYHEGYGWKVLYWSSHPGAGSVMPILRALAVAIAFPVCQVVTRRGSVWSAMPLALLPLGSTLLLVDTVPDSVYLLAYLFGVIMLLLTQGVRRRQASQGNALSAQVALPLAVVLGLIFLLNPQKDYNKQYLADKLDAAFSSLLGRFEQMESPKDIPGDISISDGVDTASTVSLDNVGPQNQGKQVVMTVVSSRGGRIYLRGASFADYDGTSWHKGTQDDGRNQWPKFNGEAQEETLIITTKKAHNVLYLPYYTPRLREIQRGRVENSDNEKTYQVTYYRMSADAMGQASAIWVEDDYTYLPWGTRQWAAELAQELTGGYVDGGNAQEVISAAQKIGAYVKASAKYSLNTPQMPEGEDDFARWFLEDSDTGYCVHFATAATVLLRGAGIPARYVSGYTVEAKREKTVEVTASNAHAWVEYYVPGFGWTVLDPTPGNTFSPQLPPVETTPPATTPEITTPPATTPPEDTAQTRPGQTTAEATKPAPGDTTAPGDTAVATAPGSTTAPAAQTPPKKPVNLTWLKYLLWPMAAAGLILGQWWVRVRLRKQRLRSDRGNRRALRYWREAERLAALLGEKPPDNLRTLAQKAKFSQHTLAREELIQMRGYLTACEARLRKHPWYKQLLYRLVYAIY